MQVFRLGINLPSDTARPRHRLLERPVLESRWPDLLFRPHLYAEGFVWSTSVYEGKLVHFAPDGTLDRTVGLPVENATSVYSAAPILTSPTSPRWHAS